MSLANSRVFPVVDVGVDGTAEESVSLIKNRQFETMAMTITAADASAIIAMKYPDLLERLPTHDAVMCTPPSPARLHRKRPLTPAYRKRMRLVDHFKQAAKGRTKIRTSSLHSPVQDYHERAAFLPSASPRKAERLSSFLRVRSLSTSTKKSRRGSRSLLDRAKRFRLHRAPQTTVGLKHTILRLCGVSKSPYSGKYMSIQGNKKLELHW